MKLFTTTSLAWILLNIDSSFAGPAMVVYQELAPRSGALVKRAECGPGVGSCDPGVCCSEEGWCGITEDYCAGSECQLDYSDACDTFTRPKGTSTESVPRPRIGNVPYGTIITDCTSEGKMALTFDDGPDIYTNQILDILDDYGVKATFFVSGNNRGKGEIDDPANGWEGVLRRMHSAGHHICSHTWSHRSLDEVNSTIQHTEIIYNEMAFRNIFGWFPTYIRPPFLECSASTGCISLLNELGYHIITENIDTKDYENDAASLIQISKDRFSTGVSTDAPDHEYIVLAHDVHYQTVINLTAYMINTTRDRGYELVTLGECLNDPEENWYRDAPGGPETRTLPSSVTSLIRTSFATPSATIVPSPNQQCGGNTGYTCQGSKFGTCCSFYGYCGSGTEYCGTGCDPNFGTCNPQSVNITDTTNGLCGPQFRTSCSNFGSKTCCSAYGYCGNSDEHCGTGCQSAYGTCK